MNFEMEKKKFWVKIKDYKLFEFRKMNDDHFFVRKCECSSFGDEKKLE